MKEQREKYRLYRLLIELISSSLSICLICIILTILLVQCEDPGNISGNENPEEVEIIPDPGMDLYGFIGDNDGNPIEGVVVSDGYNCVLTDMNGIYQMERNANAQFVFYSTPSGYYVNTMSETINMASFYEKISNEERYDFKLTKLEKDESDFKLICIGDPQVTKAEEITRFKTETIKDLNEFIATESLPCYGLVMGDVVGDEPALFGQMKVLLGNTKMSVFTAIGNHDKVATTDNTEPRTTSDFTSVFGPLNYSFNRGDVHFVCLDNVIFDDSENYSGGFIASQVEWLKQDLSHVSKDKMVILYFHIPLRGSSSIANKNDVLQILDGFAEVHLMSGHTHYNENYVHTSPFEIYEHVHAATCGSWWRSTINGDGTPNGYAVYHISGATIKDWYYKPTQIDKSFQIRLHKGNVVFGGDFGYYSFGQAENNIVVNVWNADNDWKIEAYENGDKVADLTQLPLTSKDAWALGYHIGVLNRNPDNYSPNCKHLFLYTPTSENANFEIKATDRFGNVYTQSEVTSGFESAQGY